MPTIREILEARNEIAVHRQEYGTVTEDDILKICFNKQVEDRDTNAKNKQNRRKPKVITYLNKQDRDAVIMLSAVTQSLQNIIDEWDGLRNRPSFVLGALRTANTMVYKVIEWMIKDVPAKDYLKVVSDVGYFQIGIYEYSPKRRMEG
jgi:dsDNA-specific endonuclease/ATPase MutS2